MSPHVSYVTKPARFRQPSNGSGTALAALSREEYEQFARQMAALKTNYGEARVKAEAKRPPPTHKKPPGRPPKWRDEHLYSLWMMVQFKAISNFDGDIAKSCRHLAKSGGINRLAIESGELVEYSLAASAGRIRSLYYQAQSKLNQFELDCKPIDRIRHQKYTSIISTNFKEILEGVIGYFVYTKQEIPPILDYFSYFVNNELYRRGMIPGPPKILLDCLEPKPSPIASNFENPGDDQDTPSVVVTHVPVNPLDIDRPGKR